MKEIYTLINNRGILLSRTIIFLIRFGIVVYFLLVCYGIYLLLNEKDYLSISSRTILVIISFIPLFISLYTFYAYEHIYPNRNYTISTLFKFSFFVVYLFLPSIVILLRYQGFIAILSAFGSSIGFIFGFILAPFLKENPQRINIGDLVKEILYTAWCSESKSVNPNYFNIPKYEENRKKEYLNSENLNVFQSSFLNVSLEHQLVGNTIKNTNFKNSHSSINVLDIGGHNGIFTSKLLGQINIKVNSVLMIDPIQNYEYTKNVQELTDKITIVKKKIEDFIPENEIKFELIIASHSLYSLIDGNKNGYKNIVTQISNYLSDNGLLLIVLGSKTSPAYQLKSSILELLSNYNESDGNAELLIEFLNQQKILKFSSHTIDNYINSTDLINDDKILRKWVSYFVRTFDIKDNHLLNQIKKMILFYSSKPSELPECVVNVDRYSDTQLLMHKTKAVLISTAANNVFKKKR